MIMPYHILGAKPLGGFVLPKGTGAAVKHAGLLAQSIPIIIMGKPLDFFKEPRCHSYGFIDVRDSQLTFLVYASPD